MVNSTKITMDKNNNETDREKMMDYWNKHSKDCSIQEMMLDTNAKVINDKELPEILSILPNYSGKDILELGAGIGRFTKVIAAKAKSVIAVDFIEQFIEKNRQDNAHMGNIKFNVGDATKIAYESDQFGMIFTNWLLMYLSDNEIEGLVENSLNFIQEDGYFFIRESCFHPSGNIKNIKGKNDNPTVYRHPKDYIQLYLSKIIEKNGEHYGFELVFARPNRAYISIKNNSNQVCFLFKKVKLDNHKGFKTMQEFLDKQQYSIDSILQYEKIFGPTHICPGGQESTDLFFANLDLKPGQRVLDIGCGIGGAATYISKKYDVEVYGIDLSKNMVSTAWDRLQEIKKNDDLQVRFEIGDITKHAYPNQYFDYIYSRDTILHISEKRELFEKLKGWLKPNGKIFITDYTCAPKPWSDAFSSYVEGRGYSLILLEEYEQLLKEAGFKNVIGQDRTDLFMKYLIQEAENFARPEVKEDFLQSFSSEDYDYIAKSWRVKLERTKSGYQRWGTFSAQL